MNTSAEFMGYKDISQKPEDEEDSKINETPYMCVGSSLPVEKIIKKSKKYRLISLRSEESTTNRG